MKRLAAKVSKVLFNLLYKLCCAVCTRRDVVLFVSRQSNTPSSDYTMLGAAFESRGLTPVYLARKLSRKHLVAYCGHALREIAWLARCRVCIVDRYDPIICLLDFPCEHVVSQNGSALHTQFPTQPVIIQLWHAFGAFKKFGFQSLDNREGHSTQTAQDFGIHRNYSWVLCAGEGNRAAFAQAFSCPIERVVSLGRPELDVLRDRRQQIERSASGESKDRNPVVSMAPTRRKSDESSHPFRDLYAQRMAVEESLPASVQWNFHPLDSPDREAAANDAVLQGIDYVVTDYSSIVYEAYALGKRAVFYQPDLDEYRCVPGLNADLALLAPDLVFYRQDDLLDALRGFLDGSREYPQNQFDAFVGDTFSSCPDNCTDAIARFVMDVCE